MVTWGISGAECIEHNGILTGYTVVFQELGGTTIPGEVMDQSFTANDLTVKGVYNWGGGGILDILKTEIRGIQSPFCLMMPLESISLQVLCLTSLPCQSSHL